MAVMKLYGSTATSTDGLASLDCPEDGKITGILLLMSGVGVADSSHGKAEVSFASTSGFGTNDTRASLIGNAIAYEFTTSGGSMVNQAIFVPMDEVMNAGERIYLHVSCVTFTMTVSAWIYTDYKTTRQSPRRRA